MSSFVTQNNMKYYSPYFWTGHGQRLLKKAVQTFKKHFYYSYSLHLFWGGGGGFVIVLQNLLDYDV